MLKESVAIDVLKQLMHGF